MKRLHLVPSWDSIPTAVRFGKSSDEYQSPHHLQGKAHWQEDRESQVCLWPLQEARPLLALSPKLSMTAQHPPLGLHTALPSEQPFGSLDMSPLKIWQSTYR